MATPAGIRQHATLQSLLPYIDLDLLLSQIESHRASYADFMKNLGRAAAAVRETVDIVAESFSGSWFGWHAEMYYGDFEKPPWGEIFDVEWGAYHGLPPKWQPRKKVEVDKRVEQLSHYSLIELSKQQWTLARAMRELQGDFLAKLAPIANINGMDKERELLGKLDRYRWDEATNNEFIQLEKNASPHTTRDSGAAIQGFRIPSHVACAALAHSAEEFAITAEDFWEVGIRLIKQLRAHAAVSCQPAQHSSDALRVVLNICKQFHVVATELQSRHGDRVAFIINDEHDLQDLLRALLRQQFGDVRPEEVVPSTAGRSPRMDFLLKAERTVVEVKMTRDTLRDKEIGDELLQDIARYKEHPDCSTLVCFVYDPGEYLRNPNGLAADLEKQSDAKLMVKVVLCPSRN